MTLVSKIYLDTPVAEGTRWQKEAMRVFHVAKAKPLQVGGILHFPMNVEER